MKNHKLY